MRAMSAPCAWAHRAAESLLAVLQLLDEVGAEVIGDGAALEEDVLDETRGLERDDLLEVRRQEEGTDPAHRADAVGVRAAGADGGVAPESKDR